MNVRSRRLAPLAALAVVFAAAGELRAQELPPPPPPTSPPFGDHAFERLERAVASPYARASLSLERGGEVRLSERRSLGSAPEVVEGQATEAELAAVLRALHTARLAELSTDLTAGGPAATHVETVTYEVEGGSIGERRFQGPLSQIAPAVRERLRALDEALEAIAARLRAGAVQGFERLTIAIASPYGRTAARIDADGAFEAEERRSPGSAPEVVRGRASEDELRALREALARADLDGLPTDLSEGTQGPTGAPVLTIERRGGPAGDRRLFGPVAQVSPTLRPRLRPLREAMAAIVARLRRETSAGSPGDGAAANGAGVGLVERLAGLGQE